MSSNPLVDEYERGVELLRASLKEADPKQLDARPIPGKWSIREVVCHLADSEIVYADRIKRVLAEDDPMFFEADPEQFRESLRVAGRSLDDELNVIAAVRRHMVAILRDLDEAQFERVGRHSLDGPMTLTTLLERICGHIPHHVRFIEEKIVALTGG